jgi:predicted metal-binding protein
MDTPDRKHRAATTIYVCVTCRQADEPLEPRAARSGARLFAELATMAEATGIKIVPVECLSVCKRPCTVSFAAPGKWTYVYGDLPAETSAATILAGAELFASAQDGIIPWKLRPDALKRGVVARIPPLSPSTPSAEKMA